MRGYRESELLMTTDERRGVPGLPSAEEVRKEFAAILASAVFAQAGRSRELLSFVVEETLAGRGDRLKGYAVAVEVFGRAKDFDAQADPLVRVEAGRLRKRLAEYYRGAGQHANVRIELPRGGYTPSFGYAAAAQLSADPSRAGVSANNVLGARRRLPWVATGAAAFMSLAGAAFFVSHDTGPLTPASITAAPSARVTSGAVVMPGPRMLVLPVADLSDAASLHGFAGGVTEELVQALVGFNIVAVANPAGHDVESTALSALRSSRRHVLAGSARVIDGRARVAVRLIDAELGTLLWTSTFNEAVESMNAVTAEERVARNIAMVLASPLGPIYAHEIKRIAGKPIAELDPYECLLRFYDYAQSFGPTGHAESVACMQRAVLAEPRLAMAWSALATLYLHEYIHGYTPQPDRGPALDRALEAARTSLDIDSSGRVAAVALAGIRLARGDRVAFERTVARTLELRPAHPAVLANIGYLLMIAGDHERGFHLLDEAMPGIFDVPSYVYLGYALGYLQRGDYERALEAAQKIDSQDWVIAPLAKAATAALAGRRDICERELQRLLELDPDFASSVVGLLERAQLNPVTRATVIEALRSAGLAIP
jgi:adenylate cyclase